MNEDGSWHTWTWCCFNTRWCRVWTGAETWFCVDIQLHPNLQTFLQYEGRTAVFCALALFLERDHKRHICSPSTDLGWWVDLAFQECRLCVLVCPEGGRGLTVAWDWSVSPFLWQLDEPHVAEAEVDQVLQKLLSNLVLNSLPGEKPKDKNARSHSLCNF